MNSLNDLQRKLGLFLKEPENPRLLNGIGVLLYQMEDWENAGRYLKKAYELDPSDQDILYNYAALLGTRFRWKEAAAVYGAYLALCPHDEEAIEKMGDSFYQLGEYDSAARTYELLREAQKGAS